MTFCIITHVPHSQSNGTYFGYAPYVNEMNIWLKYADKVVIVAPLKPLEKSALHQEYNHSNIEFIAVPDFSVSSFKAFAKTMISLPILLYCIFNGMKKGTHIHLRCPGNMGLLGSIVQVVFPGKQKTAKYAGNWDPKSKQPFSYRLQKKIISNTFLTRNMKVLVYGNWKKQSKNILPFFTATYSEAEKKHTEPKKLDGILNFVFAGSLVSGKQPLEAIKIVAALYRKSYNVKLLLYGDGTERQHLETYIATHNLSRIVSLQGISGRDQMKKIYQHSHFLILPSKSEGWPKVVAEAMFWGCLPIATAVSCVPEMLGYGIRGILTEADFDKTVSKIEALINNQEAYDRSVEQAVRWSETFTTEKFEAHIREFLQQEKC